MNRYFLLIVIVFVSMSLLTSVSATTSFPLDLEEQNRIEEELKELHLDLQTAQHEAHHYDYENQ